MKTLYNTLLLFGLMDVVLGIFMVISFFIDGYSPLVVCGGAYLILGIVFLLWARKEGKRIERSE